jgi:hypothetical protein
MGVDKHTIVPLVGFNRCQVDGRKLCSKSETMRWFARWGQHEFVWSLEMFTPQQTPPHSVRAALFPPARPVALPQRVSHLADLPTVRYSPPDIAQPVVLFSPATPVIAPQRTVQAEQVVINSWPWKYWQMFAFVNGKRSVGQMAALLNLPLVVVESSVDDLQSLEGIQIGEHTCA